MVYWFINYSCGIVPQCKYVMDRHYGCLLIPRGVHFLPDLYPQILIPHNYVTPYCDPQTGEDAPFVTIGPFMSMDTLFHGTAGDLELYTAKEVIALRNTRIFKSSNTSPSTPKLLSLATLGQALPPPVNSKSLNHCSKVEQDSSIRK